MPTTLSELLDEPEAPPPVIFPDFKPGIYFGLDEDAYHAVPALSSSGIKWLAISPIDFWARTPWLNPNAEPEESPFMELGKAYHYRIVEGREAFAARHQAAIDRDDYPNAIDGNDELRSLLRDAGLKVGGNKAELVERWRAHRPDAVFWDDVRAAYETKHAGKTFLSHELIARIEIAAAMIEKHPALCKAFTGGQPEVSIFWRDAETGVPLKARLDYLKVQAVVDLKSFSNPLGKSIDAAIYLAITNRGYFIQAAHYLDAAAQIALLFEDGLVFGDHDSKWLEDVAANDKQFLFVFQQTGVAPLARGRVFPRGLVLGIGQEICRGAIATFRAFSESHGTGEPWLETSPIAELDNDGFPGYIGT